MGKTYKHFDIQSTETAKPVSKVKVALHRGKGRVKSYLRRGKRVKGFIREHKRALSIAASSLALGLYLKKAKSKPKKVKAPPVYNVIKTSPVVEPIIISKDFAKSRALKSQKIKKRQAAIQRELDLDLRRSSRFGGDDKVRKAKFFGLSSRDGTKLLASRRKKAAIKAREKYTNYSRYLLSWQQ